MDSFNVFAREDRESFVYLACVGGSTALGLAYGAVGGPPSQIAGAAVGLAIGLVACKRLSPALEKKLFSQNKRLSESELATVLTIVRDLTGVKCKSDAMYLVSQVRTSQSDYVEDLPKNSRACVQPRAAAAQLLAYKKRQA